MRLMNLFDNGISIRIGVVIMISLVFCGSMKSSTPPPGKDRLTEIDSLERDITGLPDDSVYFTHIAAVGFALSARAQNERLLSTSL